jgi:hypothetical protein
MKVTLPALGVMCAAALFYASAGAQEGAGVPSAPKTAAERGDALSERVRRLLAEAGVGVGAAGANSSSASRTHREVALTWEADKASLPEPAAAQYRNAQGRVALARAAERRAGALPKQRSAELSSGQVVVVALDAAGRMLWCGLVEDPRLLRAEWPGPDGQLTGQVIYRESAEFVVEYPDDEAIAEVRLYHPDWDGQKFSLKLVGAVAPR